MADDLYLEAAVPEVGSEPDLGAPLQAWNATDAPYPCEALVHELFEGQAARAPGATAVVLGDLSLSYGELNAQANRLARHLRTLGVGPDVRVAICVERSLEMVVGLLAVLKAGGAYVPLDPAYPAERLAFMLEDAAPAAVLTHAAARGSLEAALVGLAQSPAVVDLCEASAWAPACDDNLDPALLGLTSRHLAYVIYTSGSTGTPKGAMNTHQGLVNRLVWMQEAYGLGLDDAVLQKTPFSFDVSVWEFLWPLMAGARLVLARPEGHRDPTYLAALIRSAGITRLHFVPSMLGAFLQEDTAPACVALKDVFCSGEALPAALARTFHRILPGVRLHNLYGPTEAAIDVTAWTCDWAWLETTGAAPPIGRPIANTRIYILDGDLQPVPVGVGGELHIGGVGVSRGYLNRPELTAERFIASPFVEGDRLYRTGDLARWRPDGTIEFLGRNDFQVKVRGFRIELGEIEARLAEQPGVREAVVLAREDAPGDRRLVAYVTGERDLHAREEDLVELPNGLRVWGANLHETVGLYEEIFEDESYRFPDLELPEGACVLDVGANIGLFSLYVKGVEPTARVFAFEPIASTFERLQANTAAYALDVALRPYGLSDADGRAVFRHYPQMSLNSGRYAEPAVERQLTRTYLENRSGVRDGGFDELLEKRFEYEEQTCELLTLSSVIAQEGLERIDLLKIDVEKSELDVLNGLAEDDWPKVRQLVVEVHDLGGRLAIIGELLSARGFRVHVTQKQTLADTGLHTVFASRAPQRHSVAPMAEWTFARFTAHRPVVSPAVLRARLSTMLPEHMVPAALVRLAGLPLTPNGKLDRQALPAPDGRAYASRTYEAPQGATEEALAGIWRDVLGLERVGRHDNFIELGGHSLAATRILVRVREGFGGPVSVNDVLTRPTIAVFAAALGAPGPAASAARPTRPAASSPSELPLSHQQSGVWIAQGLAPTSQTFNFQRVVALHGEISLAAAQASLDELVALHEICRTTFHVNHDGVPFQRIHPPGPAALRYERLTPGGRTLEEIVSGALARRFALDRLPLVEWTLAQVSEDHAVLVHVEHHLIHDGWTANAILAAFLGAYRRRLGLAPAGPVEPLFARPAQYASYVAWQRSPEREPEFERHVAFWRRKLDGAEFNPPLAGDLPRPSDPGYRGAQIRVPVDRDLLARVRRECRRAQVTSFTGFMAAFAVLVLRFGGQRDFVLGTGVANRNSLEAEASLGMFVNTVLVRCTPDPDATFATLLANVGAELSEALAHDELPFELLVKEINPPRVAGQNPLFQVIFSAHDTPLPGLDGPGVRADLTEALSNGTAKFDLDVTVIPDAKSPDAAQVIWNYSTDLFSPETMQRLSSAYPRLLEQCFDDVGRRLADFDILAPEERHQILQAWNATDAPYPSEALVHELFEGQVVRAPGATAVVLGDLSLSYGELNARANRLARHLRTLGVGPDVRVAICVERSLEMVVGLLAVLKAGGAYVPLDPAYPAERLAFMLEDAAPAAVLTHAAARGSLEAALAGLAAGPAVIDLVADAGRWAGEPDADLSVPGLTSRHLAHVIYTSGSTGQPKGAMIEHRNVAARLVGHNGCVPIRPGDVLLNASSPAFDGTTLEVWSALLNGAQVVLYPGARVDVAELVGVIDAHKVTIVWMTARLFDLYALHEKKGCPSLTHIMTGGETVSPLEVRRCYERDPDVRIVNGYGPTENTIFSLAYPIPRDHDWSRPVPIGRTIANSRTYILDGGLQPVPVGVMGEIHVGGPGVARGYLNRPELTAERFVESPFVAGDRLYRTGDLGRWRPDGAIDFLGRNDFQVKIRGFRIDLEEIEAKLLAHPGVREAVVLAREDAPGETRLVGYYTLEAGAEVGPEALRAGLAASLPEHMVPVAHVRLDALPLTPNGKLDRRALPAPDAAAYAQRAYEAPQGTMEEALSAIWSEVLGIEQVGRHDDFFELGGHSLLATRVVSRVRETLGVEAGANALFARPVLSGLAAALSAQQAAAARREADVSQRLEKTIEGMSDDEVDALLESLEGEGVS